MQARADTGLGPKERVEGAPALRPRISWGAILAGALLAVAVGGMLNILGMALGATTVDTVDRGTPSASSFGIGAGIWILLSNIIGLAVGGYVAARLSGTADRMDAGLHGLGVWSAAYLLSAVLLGNVVAGATSTALRTVSDAVGGLARGAGSAASGVAQQADPQALGERARTALTAPTDAGRMTSEQRTAEIGSIVAGRITSGTLSDSDRRRLSALVAAEAGIPEQEAMQRIQGLETEAQRLAREAEERARRTADAAASAAATAAFWVFGSLLLGALAALSGARAGARKVLASQHLG